MHIYLFAPIAYDFLHQRPQKLAEQFRSKSIPVTYVQPLGFREYLSGRRRGFFKACLSSLWYHLLAIFALVMPRSSNRTGKASSVKQSEPVVRVISLPLTIPVNRADSVLVESLVASVYRQFLRKEVVSANEHDAIAIFQNPFWGRVVEKGDFSKICYDCIDDVILYAGNSSVDRFQSYEDQLLLKADVVVTTAATLEEHLRVKIPNHHVHRISNGVDYEWFQDQASKVIPAEVRPYKRPIVGYVGNIAGWMDYQLIAEVAAMVPDITFVFVGPIESQERIRRLQKLANIHWTGLKPYSEIPGYIKEFDVCIIPFVGGDIARTTNPVKVFEYFALGKPVVSTPLDELVPFVQSNLLLFGDSAASFCDAIKKALKEDDPVRATERRNVSKAHSWKSLAQTFINAIKEIN